ncbi:MAG TPA: PAS domain-containing protein, partial [Alphaproteobacteria bacterium]|nr:PAS domain-containing protein [Alphaproteobacteria bacterium]
MIRNLLWAAPFALVIFTLAILALAAALLIEAMPATVGYAGLGVVAALGALGFLAIRTGQRRARQGEGAAELFRGALSGSREAWLITSLDGRTLYANRALRALAGGGSEAPSLNLLWPMGSSEAAR